MHYLYTKCIIYIIRCICDNIDDAESRCNYHMTSHMIVSTTCGRSFVELTTDMSTTDMDLQALSGAVSGAVVNAVAQAFGQQQRQSAELPAGGPQLQQSHTAE